MKQMCCLDHAELGVVLVVGEKKRFADFLLAHLFAQVVVDLDLASDLDRLDEAVCHHCFDMP